MYIYQKIVCDILQRLKNHEWRIGDKLPPERTLMESYAVSDTTIKKALRQLAVEGIVEKRRGSGNYIAATGCSDLRSVDLPDAVIVAYGQLSLHPMLSKWFSEILSRLKKRNIVLRKFQEDIEPDSLQGIQRECPGVPIFVFNSRNHTARCAACDMLENLEELPFFPEYLNRLPRNLSRRFAGSDGALHYFAAPYSYSPCCLGINGGLAAEAGLDCSSPPETWDELFHWCEIFEKWKNHHNRRALHSLYAYRRQFMEMTGRSYFFMACEGMPYDGGIGIIRQGLERTLNWAVHMRRSGFMEAVGVQSPDPFVSGNYLFSPQGYPWLLRDLDNFRPDMRRVFVPMPAIREGGCRFNSVGTAFLSILKFSPSAKAMQTLELLLGTLLGSETVIFLTQRMGVVPADPAALQKMASRYGEFMPFQNAIFSGMEPHFVHDVECEEFIDKIIIRIFDNPDIDLARAVNDYLTFFNQLR